MWQTSGCAVCRSGVCCHSHSLAAQTTTPPPPPPSIYAPIPHPVFWEDPREPPAAMYRLVVWYMRGKKTFTKSVHCRFTKVFVPGSRPASCCGRAARQPNYLPAHTRATPPAPACRCRQGYEEAAKSFNPTDLDVDLKGCAMTTMSALSCKPMFNPPPPLPMQTELHHHREQLRHRAGGGRGLCSARFVGGQSDPKRSTPGSTPCCSAVFRRRDRAHALPQREARAGGARRDCQGHIERGLCAGAAGRRALHSVLLTTLPPTSHPARTPHPRLHRMCFCTCWTWPTPRLSGALWRSLRQRRSPATCLSTTPAACFTSASSPMTAWRRTLPSTALVGGCPLQKAEPASYSCPLQSTGTYYLTELLIPYMKTQEDPRVVGVLIIAGLGWAGQVQPNHFLLLPPLFPQITTSSGGMLLEKLDTTDFNFEKRTFKGEDVYAQHKVCVCVGGGDDRKSALSNRPCT